MSDRTPRYTLEGPCVSWAFQGRDGRWYRVCVPCDTVIPAGGTLPQYLRYGYALERDAVMSVRDHMRQMARNRAAWAGIRAREAALVRACRAEDYEEFGRLIMGDRTWIARDPYPRDEQLSIMADYLRRTGH